MEKELLQTAALDLGIVRYSSESEAQFNSRVIYSALACWIKAACQDHLAEHERSEGVSRRHIYDIRYVFDRTKEETNVVQHPRGYLLARLYEAEDVMDTYYQIRVNHDIL